jgi:hypothetical protein
MQKMVTGKKEEIKNYYKQNAKYGDSKLCSKHKNLTLRTKLIIRLGTPFSNGAAYAIWIMMAI